MVEGEENQPQSFQEEVAASIMSLEHFDSEYSAEGLLTSQQSIFGLAEEGVKRSEIDQIKAVEIQMASAERARDIASNHGDSETASLLGRKVELYKTILTVGQEPAPEGKKSTRKATRTSKKTTSKAKS